MYQIGLLTVNTDYQGLLFQGLERRHYRLEHERIRRQVKPQWAHTCSCRRHQRRLWAIEAAKIESFRSALSPTR